MDGVYKELDELKAELEKLKEEYRIKTELSESLRRAHMDQQAKSQETKLKIENQTKELNEKSEELAELRRLYVESESKLQEMESSLNQISSVNEKIRTDSGEKVQKLEDENKKLASALEEATGRTDDLERKLSACNEEVECLKTRLSESQRKCLEAEEKAREGRELRHREEVISKLEEESMSVQDQLKWKKEQFGHLKEAHSKLQDLFQSSKKEWTSEKSDMFEEMMGLQSKLDSQVRITEGLESRLKMCNQALAHEESRRKTLEVQLLESKQCFDNILVEYEEAKAKIESLSTKRAEDIASLRNSLGMKEILLKEMEYKVTHLEQDNKELLGSLKELREAQIKARKVDPSVNKLRNKLKDLEQVHSRCSEALKEREAEWTSKMEVLMGDLKYYESFLKRQREQMDQLKIQLDDCHSAVEVSGEENLILLLLMKSELSDAYSKLFESEDQIEAFRKERKEENAASSQQLEMGECSLSKAQAQVKQAHEEILSMTEKLDSMKLLEERSTLLEGVLVEHKKMLEESSDCQLRLKGQVSQMEVALKNLSTSLEKSNSELAVKIKEATQTETEMHIWKCKAEGFKTCLEQSQEVFKQMELSLLEQVQTEQGVRKENESLQCHIKEKEQKIDDLQKKISSLDQTLTEKEATEEAMKSEVVQANKRGEQLFETLQEREQKIDDLQQRISSLGQNLSEKEATGEAMKFEVVEANKRGEQLFEALQEREQKIDDLQQKISSLGQKLSEKEATGEAMKFEVVEANKRGEQLSETLQEREQKIDDLQQKISSLGQKLSEKEATGEAMKSKVVEANKRGEQLLETLKERDSTVEKLHSVIEEMAEQSTRMETTVKLEKEELCRTVTEQKDKEIRAVQEFASSLEQDFTDLVLFSFSEGTENLVKIVALEDALEKSEFRMNTDMERKNAAIDVLKSEVSNLQHRMLLQEETLLHSEKSVKELEDQIEFKNLETGKVVNQLTEQQTMLKGMVESLKHEREAALSSIKNLSIERNNLVAYIEQVSEQFDNFCSEDARLEGMLGKLFQDSDETEKFTSDKLLSSAHKDLKKEIEAICDRSPLREINQ